MTQRSNKKNLYLLHYRHPKDGKIVSLKAESVEDSSLGLSFIRISNFIFDTSSLVVRPAEEQLRKSLEGVKALHMSLYNIIAIEELGASQLKFKKDKANLISFPTSQESPSSPKK